MVPVGLMPLNVVDGVPVVVPVVGVNPVDGVVVEGVVDGVVVVGVPVVGVPVVGVPVVGVPVVGVPVVGVPVWLQRKGKRKSMPRARKCHLSNQF